MDTPVTVAATRRVRPGFEAKFEEALHDFIAHSHEEAGQGGVHVLRPAPQSSSREYGILRRFENEAARDAFYASELFREWEKTVAPLVEGETRYEKVSGFEGWLTLPGEKSIVPPPRWKTTLMTLSGVYPLSVLWPLVLTPFIGSWPLLLRAFITSVMIVLSLAYAIMPLLARLLHPWLHAGEEKQ
ncbi:antibiotic biosynthesis monooxygenase [bacterium]|nr:MAG: antibiotic biosynthesis monooxygenase [bacterium]